MTKKRYLTLFLLIFVMFYIFLSDVYANSDKLDKINKDNSNEIVEDKKDNIVSEEYIKQREELNKIIKQLLSNIRSKIKKMDDKISDIRKLEEYENYPTIRLNIDTPIFGLASIINSKLKIKHEVSATDIANGYSIRNIIKNNSIKLPEKYIAGIIVSTKDVKFDENITIEDANLAVLKLMKYTKSIDNTDEFLNNQINKIYKGYINKEKSDRLEDINKRLNNIESILLKEDENLSLLHILIYKDEDKKDYDVKVNKYVEISKKLKDNKNVSKNILMSNENLYALQKDILKLETEVLEFEEDIQSYLKHNEDKSKDIDLVIVIDSLKNELELRLKNIEKLVDNSTIKKEIKTDIEVLPKREDLNNKVKEDKTSEDDKVDKEEKIDKNSDSRDNEKEPAFEEIKQYDITSTNDIEQLKKIVNEIDSKLNYYKKLKDGIEKEKNDLKIEELEKEDVEKKFKEIENKISVEEKNNVIKELNNLYKQFISLENKFYFDNINYILKNTTLKTFELAKYSKENIISQMRYIYIQLPGKLKECMDSTNLNSVYETKILSNNLVNELNNLIDVYIKLNKIYTDLNIDKIKNND